MALGWLWVFVALGKALKDPSAGQGCLGAPGGLELSLGRGEADPTGESRGEQEQQGTAPGKGSGLSVGLLPAEPLPWVQENSRNVLMHQGQSSRTLSPRAMALKWDEGRRAALETLPVPGKGSCSPCSLWNEHQQGCAEQARALVSAVRNPVNISGGFRQKQR